jgi:hypothetical protein
LDEEDYQRVKNYEADFHAAFNNKVAYLDEQVSLVLELADGDKKKLAVEILPASPLTKNEYPIAFKMADGGYNVGNLVMANVTAKLSNTAKYNELAEWLGIDNNVA